MIRERLFHHIRQEVPYSCSVVVQECRRFEEDDGRSVVQASASIVVKKALHKVRFRTVASCLS
jgi:GTPase Era involved in 16S rRNA processing